MNNRPSCLCGNCQTCKSRRYWHNWRARQLARQNGDPKPPPKAATPSKPASVTKRRKRTGPPIPNHARALKFNAKTRPYDPVAAAEHIIAVFMECPAHDKPHLLARIEMLVRDVKPTYGGFRFPDIPS